MAGPKDSTSSTTTTPAKPPMNRWAGLLLLLLLAGPVILSAILYQLQGFDAAALPDDYSSATITVPERNDRVLAASERVGDGLFLGPEDLAYDAEAGLLYSGCTDGWIKRVRLMEEDLGVVENWAYVGGRPLGIAFGPDGNLVVADAHKGLLMVTKDGMVDLLTDEAEGIKFALTDGVDVASNGIIYFTDASYKYNLDMSMVDILEGRPYGRLMSFDPSTNQTQVLIRDLYFANGLSLSPDQESLIFCETTLRRCKRYHIQGEKKGTVDKFIENLPGVPDNVRYDGEGRYWIAIAAGKSITWDLLCKYPFLRNMKVALGNYVTIPYLERDSGVLSVSLEGKPLAFYSDPGLYLVTSGLKIGRYLYYGSLRKSYVSRIDLTEHAARAK